MPKRKHNENKKTVLQPISYNIFKLLNTGEISKKLFKRISEIYGIPVKELMPQIILASRGLSKHILGCFSSDGYWIMLNMEEIKKELKKRKRDKTIFEHTVDEELLHAAQAILGRGGELGKKFKYGAPNNSAFKDTFIKIFGTEPSAKPHLKSKRECLASTLAYIPAPWFLFFTALNLIRPGFLGYAALFATMFFGYKARKNAVEYYKRHGVDGLILLYADPPKAWNMVLLKKKERYFVENGYLLPEGGLTRKGLKYLKHILPRDVLLENLKIVRGQYESFYVRAVRKWAKSKPRISERSKRILRRHGLHKRA